MGLRKKQMGFLFLILVCVFAYATWTLNQQQNDLSNEDFIRFHVIANSDSAEDQALKLKVRDGVLAKINRELVQEAMARHNVEYADDGLAAMAWNELEEGEEPKSTVTLDLESSKAYIREHIEEIEITAEQIIRDNGYDYTAKAALGVTWIPQKTYGDLTFPAGNYEALNITIGTGEGQNWWCVLFPPLCLIGAADPYAEVTEEEAAVQEIYQSAMMDTKYDKLTEETGKPTTLKLKFKTLEVVKGKK